MIFKILLLSFFPFLMARAQLIADFVTTEGNFSVDLDYVNAPLACANFVLLSGKGTDVWETPAGAASYTSTLYNTVAESDSVRLQLNVRLFEENPGVPGTPSRYDIYQQNTYLGSVNTFPNSFGVLSDITGENRFEMKRIQSNPSKFQIRFNYPRPWVDSRFQTIREAPMFRSIPITRVERGKRFFSGSFTNNDFDHPGYHFQDENIRLPLNSINPYGNYFNSAWILAMDSTAKNTNGSRFFITSAPDASWNGRYTPFGVVLQNIGRQVVTNIANSATNASGVPNEPMSILSISFRRGLGATSFFESYHQGFLPGSIRALPFTMGRRNGSFSLITPLRPRSFTSISTSFDLKTFQTGGILSQSPLITEEPAIDLSMIMGTAPRFFFKGFTTSLPNWPSADLNLKGSRYFFKLNSANASGSLSLDFDVEGNTAFYEVDTVAQRNLPGEDPVTLVNQGSGIVGVTYDSTPGPYKGKMTLNVITGALNVDELTLNFEAFPGPASTVVRSFSALKSDSGPFFFGFNGHYQQVN